ncbi:aminoacyl-tRNA hydrolase [Thermodesulfobium sp. 4217-1]|uniref:aminoacyl-tRNA hydrolase n=1 Tax=Thermodesulfobium sp. 4217-1 TaxID=3120013 RepID=UPI0032216C93
MNLDCLFDKKEIFLIVGLGNIGQEYSLTRHNIGFLFLDFLADSLGIKLSGYKTKINNLIFLKPTTYMNRSGIAVQEVSSFYKIEPKNIIVIYDDMDLDFKTIRFRPKGSSGGHKGIGSIIDILGTDSIPRIKIGIGREKNAEAKDYVLSRFNSDEMLYLPEIFDAAKNCLEIFLEKGASLALEKCGRVKIIS